MALPISYALVGRAAVQLADGGWRYTMRQLYYASCAEAEIGPSHAAATGEMALGVLVVLVSLILIAFKPLFGALLALGVLIFLLGLLHRLTYHRPAGRLLAMSYPEFTQRFGSMQLTGLIREIQRSATATATGGSVLVCDSAETASAVTANIAKAELQNMTILSASELEEHTTAGSVLVLHDASPRGCALPLDLRDAGYEVVDCGLRPAAVDEQSMQVIQGAPARLPRDLRPLLTDDEITWLLSGRRVELATLSPPRLMGLVRAAREGETQRSPVVRAVDPSDGVRDAIVGV